MTIGEYEVFTNSPLPYDATNVIQMTRWKTLFSMNERKKERRLQLRYISLLIQ